MNLQKANIKDIHESVLERLLEKTGPLISGFLEETEPDFLKKHARILDDYFRQCFENSMVGPRMAADKNLYAIIALGGYGREEQCIHSDVDLLFLFEKSVPKDAEDLVREIIYPLWDMGLDVGYATRAIKECVNLALEEVEVLTSILDARFICGMSPLYSTLMEKLGHRITPRRSNKIIASLIENNRQRHMYFGDSVYLFEPNLKEGQGGLRDYHTMLWIARIKSNLRQFRDFEYHGYLSHDEFESLREALQFIWNIRNRLHHITGRKCDQLYFEYQAPLATALKFKKENGQQPVERFLSELHGHMEFLKQQHLIFLYELGYASNSKRKRKTKKYTTVKGLEVSKEGMLNFVSSEVILKSPGLLMKIFEESARLKIPLSIEAKRLAREFRYLIDDDYLFALKNIQSFHYILTAPTPTFNVLNEMLNAGLLTQYLPEFKDIENRIQYDEYHLYPVDRHSLRTVQIIKSFGTKEGASKVPLCGDLYKELNNRRPLLWAALLHDIGKGVPGESHSKTGAKIVRRALPKRGFKDKEVETVSFLVEEHLMLFKTATRRDLYDEETAIFCARKIKDVRHLKMLYLLTVADAMATGPKAWNEWTAALLKDLFFKVLKILEHGELATREAVKGVEEKKKEVLSSGFELHPRQELETLFDFMSPRYLLYTPAENILEHIKLYQNIGTDDFIWKVVQTPDSNTRTVTICARDRPGLISKIAGTFTLNGLDIFNVQVFTWRNNIALDIFEVKPPPDRIYETKTWERAAKQLQSALVGELDLTAALSEKMDVYRSTKYRPGNRPHKVVLDNNSSSFFTIVEVFTYDFPGLLYSITDALFRCRLDVWVAKISTKVDQVVDVFYVRDFDGQKVDLPDQVAAVKTAIEDVLP
ncbi:MAG: [protein-PII] uridylyltransferase [Deltaproteobacteria bacterium]|nr:MAG: [protein-PII] uridylyltransferase [Deltaproteobacteria bacterium]